ncbi:MAG: hypothetical protein ACREJ7_09250 [Candidatus Methylomirabilales bacterium]|jgi:hypothetical protein|nr:hypothetical protein [candidate division NC10 bacterium]MBI4413613.1 hypothetical protein [candidate division NC10 bacterium]
MAKAEVKTAKLASREIAQPEKVHPCPQDGAKMVWVTYYPEQGRAKSALRCEKCGTLKFRSELN